MARWHKSSSSSRGYGAAWNRKRKRVLSRDKYLCQECLRHDILTPLETGDRTNPRNANVDHITPKAQGGTDQLDNLEALCKSCHDRKTNAERDGKATPQGCKANGLPVDRKHHWNSR